MGRVIWTHEAQERRKEIFRYWNKRNGSNSYSLKLNTEIKRILGMIKENPFVGVKVEQKEFVRRVSVFAHYSIFYTITDENIVVLLFWNDRQGPDNLVL